MELESSYELLGILRDDGIRTYRAVEITSGQAMEVHLFARPESEADRSLFKALRALPVSKRKDILEIGIEEDQPYVVTEQLPETTTAREWLSKLTGAPAKSQLDPVVLAGSWKTGTPIPDELIKVQHLAPPPLPQKPAANPATMTPDYTRVIRVPRVEPPIRNISSPAAPPPSAPSEPPRLPEPPALAIQQPPAPPDVLPSPSDALIGEVPSPVPHVLPTEVPLPEVPLPEVSLPEVSLPEVPRREPGEFTRMFQLDHTPVKSSTAAMSEQGKEPGEFTGMFLAAELAEPKPAAQPPASTPPIAAPIATPIAAPTPNAQPPGEFTAMFMAPIGKPGKSDNSEPGQFTSAFMASKPPETAPLVADTTSVYHPSISPQPLQTPSPAPPLQARQPSPVERSPMQPSSEEPTRLFQAIIPSLPPSAEPAPPFPQALPKEPGEFTRMFPPARPEPPSQPLTPAPDAPSEFTQFFQSPIYPSSEKQKLPSLSSSSVPSALPAKPAARDSEFTQMFGPSSTPAGRHASSMGNPLAKPPAKPLASPNTTPPVPASSATGVFASPAASPIRPGNNAVDDGEFNRMMSVNAKNTLGQHAAQTAPTPKKKSMLLIYIAGGAILLALVLIALFFLFMR